MNRLVLLLLLLLLMLVPGSAVAACDVGCEHIDIGGGTLVANAFTCELSGMGGTDPESSYFPIASLNGTYVVYWTYDTGFAPAQWMWKGVNPSGGQNGQPFIRVLRNYPSAGQCEVWICAHYLDGGQVYAKYRTTTGLPSNAPFTAGNRVYLNEYASAPGSVSFEPCEVCPLCDEECDPACRANMEPPDPCAQIDGQNVCAECWCDPSWRSAHGNPCVDVNPHDGICDGNSCNCHPAMRAYLGELCEDNNYDGKCDDCPNDGGGDEDGDGIPNECDVDWRYEHDLELCADVNENGECDNCEEGDCQDDDICNECDVDWMQHYYGGCVDVNENGVCDYCEGASERGLPEMETPEIDVEMPNPEFTESYVDMDLSIPLPGQGYRNYRLSTEPGRMLGYGAMPSASGTFLGYVVEKLLLVRQYVRFALLLFVTWVFVTRVLRMLFDL